MSAKARAVELEQQVAILRMGDVVPAETVVAERQRGGERNRRQHREQTRGRLKLSAGRAPSIGNVYLVASVKSFSTYSQFTR